MPLPPLNVALSAAVLGLSFGLATGAPQAVSAADQAPLATTQSSETLPEKKRTQADLYITADRSGEILAARDDVLLLDVRTPEETMLVGYPAPSDANIPFKLIDPAHAFNAEKGSYEMMPNPGFVPAVTAMLEATDPAAVIIMCRSGGRSAAAVDKLLAAGVDVPLYSMVDGFEGDKNEDGRRAVNGWKNAGLDWTYKISADLLRGVE